MNDSDAGPATYGLGVAIGKESVLGTKEREKGCECRLEFRGKGTQAGFSGASRKETCGKWGPWWFDNDGKRGLLG